MSFSTVTTTADFGDATTGLHSRAGALGTSTSRQLRRLQDEWGLNQRRLQLLSTNLGVARDWQYRPSMSHFWTEVAEPRHDLFVVEGVGILNDAADQMVELLDNSEHGFADVAMRFSAVEQLTETLHLPDDVLRLGDRWLRELQLRAAARVAGNWVARRTGGISAGYRYAEMELLDSPPWCYQDRLLAAFEAAHRQLGQHRARLIERLEWAAERPAGGKRT